MRALQQLVRQLSAQQEQGQRPGQSGDVPYVSASHEKNETSRAFGASGAAEEVSSHPELAVPTYGGSLELSTPGAIDTRAGGCDPSQQHEDRSSADGGDGGGEGDRAAQPDRAGGEGGGAAGSTSGQRDLPEAAPLPVLALPVSPKSHSRGAAAAHNASSSRSRISSGGEEEEEGELEGRPGPVTAATAATAQSSATATATAGLYAHPSATAVSINAASHRAASAYRGPHMHSTGKSAHIHSAHSVHRRSSLSDYDDEDISMLGGEAATFAESSVSERK